MKNMIFFGFLVLFAEFFCAKVCFEFLIRLFFLQESKIMYKKYSKNMLLFR